MRQTREPRGIVAAGSVTSLPQEVPHWVPERGALGHTAITVGANSDQFFADPVVVENSLDYIVECDGAVEISTVRCIDF
jgi:hypothetical protein